MKRKLGARLISMLMGAVMCLSVLPVSVAAAQDGLSPRGVTFTVRLDGDSLRKTTINSWYDQVNVNQGACETFYLENDYPFYQTLLRTVRGLILVPELPQLGNVQIVDATLHMKTAATNYPNVRLYQTMVTYDPSTVTWNSMPYAMGIVGDFSGQGEYVYNLTNLVQKTLNRGGTSIGFMLSLEEQFQSFALGDANDYIEIRYTR